MSSWNELKRSFRDALIHGFTVDTLEQMLRIQCERELEQLSGRNQAKQKSSTM